MKVSAAQLAPEWLQRERLAQWADRWTARGGELVAFPELSNTGFVTPVMTDDGSSFGEDTSAGDFMVKCKSSAGSVRGPTTELLSQVARRRNIYIVAGLVQPHLWVALPGDAAGSSRLNRCAALSTP